MPSGPSKATNINCFHWGIRWYNKNSKISLRIWFTDKRCYLKNYKWSRSTERWISKYIIRYISSWFTGKCASRWRSNINRWSSDSNESEKRYDYSWPPNPLTNFGAQKYKEESQFNYVYSEDNLPKTKDVAYIKNLDEYKSTETQWIIMM